MLGCCFLLIFLSLLQEKLKKILQKILSVYQCICSKFAMRMKIFTFKSFSVTLIDDFFRYISLDIYNNFHIKYQIFSFLFFHTRYFNLDCCTNTFTVFLPFLTQSSFPVFSAFGNSIHFITQIRECGSSSLSFSIFDL